jgi:hypothetical protein
MTTPIEKKSSLSKWVKQSIGIIVSVVCLWLVFHDTNVDELKNALANLKWEYVLLGVASLSIDYAIRVKRWALMLQATGANVKSMDCAPAFLGSIALNNVYPLRAGDVVRALVFPAAMGINRVTSTASLVLERLLDLLTLLICFGIGLSLSSITHIPDWLGKSILTLSITGGAVLFFIVAFSKLIVKWLTTLKNYLVAEQHPRFANIVSVISDLLSHLKTMAHPRILLSLFLLSMLAWVGEAGLFWALLKGLSIDIPPVGALVIMAIATISTLAPSSPGYAGTFDFAVKMAVVLLGCTPSQGASFAIVVHLGIWLPTTLVGGIALLRNPSLFKKATS